MGPTVLLSALRSGLAGSCADPSESWRLGVLGARLERWSHALSRGAGLPGLPVFAAESEALATHSGLKQRYGDDSLWPELERFREPLQGLLAAFSSTAQSWATQEGRVAGRRSLDPRVLALEASLSAGSIRRAASADSRPWKALNEMGLAPADAASWEQ